MATRVVVVVVGQRGLQHFRQLLNNHDSIIYVALLASDPESSSAGRGKCGQEGNCRS